MLRRILLGIAILLSFAFAWLGLSGGVDDLPLSTTTGQKVQSVMQLVYGAFALLTAVTTFWGRRWACLTRICWVLSCTIAAGLASVVWGGTTLAIGFFSAVAGAAMALGVIWLLETGARGLTRHSSAPSADPTL